MITNIRGAHVPITVRSLAMRGMGANAFERAGSTEVYGVRVRERATNWIALALLLGSWNVEARLAGAAPCQLTGHTIRAIRPTGCGLDWTSPKPTRWTCCAARVL